MAYFIETNIPLGVKSVDHSLTGLPEDNGEAAEANRKDREARSIAIEKVNYTNQNLNLNCKKLFL